MNVKDRVIFFRLEFEDIDTVYKWEKLQEMLKNGEKNILATKEEDLHKVIELLPKNKFFLILIESDKKEIEPGKNFIVLRTRVKNIVDHIEIIEELTKNFNVIRFITDAIPFMSYFLGNYNKMKNFIKNLMEEIEKEKEVELVFSYKKLNKKFHLFEAVGKNKEDLPIDIRDFELYFREEPLLIEKISGFPVSDVFVIPVFVGQEIAGFIGIKYREKELKEDLKTFLYFLTLSFEIFLFQEKIEDIITKDDLTELKNSRFFLISLKKLISSEENLPVTAIFMDLDNFKEINDTHGHFVGGKVLQKIGEFLKESFISSDYSYAIISRYGGDEFAFLLPKTPLEEGVVVAEMIRGAISDYEIKVRENLVFKIKASFGVATYPTSTDKYEKLLVLADKALFEAKEKGGDSVVSYPKLEKRENLP